MAMCGGFKAAQECGEEEHAIIAGLKKAIEQKLGAAYSKFEGKSFTTQVVAGTNYIMKIEVDGGEYLHCKIHKPLPHTQNPPILMEAQKATLEEALMM